MAEAKPPQHVTAAEWDDFYRSGNLPWDTQRPSPELVLVLESGFAQPGRAIDLGCGTGSNSIYLAQQGFHVTAVDLSAVAIDRARQRAQTAAVRVDYFVADVASVAVGETFDFVFDRGCYHCVRRTNLAGYVATVEGLTRPGSRFLLLAGNANEAARDNGPPRVSDEEIRAELGTLFDIQWIRPFRFENPDGGEGPLAWSVGMIRRDV